MSVEPPRYSMSFVLLPGQGDKIENIRCCYIFGLELPDSKDNYWKQWEMEIYLKLVNWWKRGWTLIVLTRSISLISFELRIKTKNRWPRYFFFSTFFLIKWSNPWYILYNLKFFLRSGQKSPKSRNQTFFLTHRKTKNPRSKKFRYKRFMETFNI